MLIKKSKHDFVKKSKGIREVRIPFSKKEKIVWKAHCQVKVLISNK